MSALKDYSNWVIAVLSIIAGIFATITAVYAFGGSTETEKYQNNQVREYVKTTLAPLPAEVSNLRRDTDSLIKEIGEHNSNISELKDHFQKQETTLAEIQRDIYYIRKALEKPSNDESKR